MKLMKNIYWYGECWQASLSCSWDFWLFTDRSCQVWMKPSLDDHLCEKEKHKIKLLQQTDEASSLSYSTSKKTGHVSLSSHIEPLLLSRLFLSGTSLIASFSHGCWQFSTSVLREPPLPSIILFLSVFFFPGQRPVHTSESPKQSFLSDFFTSRQTRDRSHKVVSQPLRSSRGHYH